MLDLHGRFDIETYRPVIVSLEGDFADNLAFNRSQILAEGPTGDNFNASRETVRVSTPTFENSLLMAMQRLQYLKSGNYVTHCTAP